MINRPLGFLLEGLFSLSLSVYLSSSSMQDKKKTLRWFLFFLINFDERDFSPQLAVTSEARVVAWHSEMAEVSQKNAAVC